MFLRQLDMRYFGQGYELTIPVPIPLNVEEFSRVAESFHNKHEAIYGYSMREENVELVNARVMAIGIVTKPRLAEQRLFDEEPSKEALLTTRDVFFEKYNNYVKCPIFIREKLHFGNQISGPAVIEQYDSTTVIYPDWKAKVDKFGNILLKIRGGV